MDKGDGNKAKPQKTGMRKLASLLDKGIAGLGLFKLQDNRWYVARRTRQNTEGAACTEIKNS
jgi:hypothetical protein